VLYVTMYTWVRNVNSRTAWLAPPSLSWPWVSISDEIWLLVFHLHAENNYLLANWLNTLFVRQHFPPACIDEKFQCLFSQVYAYNRNPPLPIVLNDLTHINTRLVRDFSAYRYSVSANISSPFILHYVLMLLQVNSPTK
jgi:hypothetical protein